MNRVRLRGSLTALTTLLISNVFSVGAVLLALSTIWSDQGYEFLRIAKESPNFSAATISVYLPLVCGWLLLLISTVFVGYALDEELAEIAHRFQLPRALVFVSAFVVLPTVIATAPAFFIAAHASYAIVWVIWVALFFGSLLGLTVWAIGNKRRGARGISNRTIVGIGVLIPLSMGVCFAIAVTPANSRALGTLGLILVGGPFWALTLSTLFVAIPKVKGWPGLALVPLLMWILATALYDPNVFPHPHFTPTNEPDSPGSWTLDEKRAYLDFEIDEWSKQFWDEPGDERIPLYLISAEGGGIRAAYWTGAVLSALDLKTTGDFRRHILVLSGVSGGSVGLAAYATAAFRNRRTPEEVSIEISRFFENDLLSPLVARLLMTEPLRQISGSLSGQMPRDQAFEETLSADWKKVAGTDDFSYPFLETFETNYKDSSRRFFPIIYFNSTIVETGLRAILSNTANLFGGPTKDLFNRDSGADRKLARISVAEAAHLSARFPYISPPATILAQYLPLSYNDNPERRETRLWGHLVDGGYLDNSAGDNFESFVNHLNARRGIALECVRNRNRNCSPEADAIKAANVLRRIQVVVIAIRNDPFERGSRVFDIPALALLGTDRLIAGSTFKDGNFKDGFLASNLPKTSRGEEIWGHQRR